MCILLFATAHISSKNIHGIMYALIHDAYHLVFLFSNINGNQLLRSCISVKSRETALGYLLRMWTDNLNPAKMMSTILFSSLICNTLCSSSVKEDRDILLKDSARTLQNSLLQSKDFQKIIMETKSFQKVKREFMIAEEERKRKEEVNIFISNHFEYVFQSEV